MTCGRITLLGFLLLLGCAVCFSGCSAEKRGYRKFSAMGGLVSDWPEFGIQSFQSNLLLGSQPVDPPSKYRDQ